MDKSIQNWITDAYGAWTSIQLLSSQRVTVIPMQRLRETNSTDFHSSFWNQARTAACTDPAVENWATEFRPPPTSWKVADCTPSPSMNIDSICNVVCCHTKLNQQAKCVYFLTHCPLLPADGGTWRSPFPSESWYRAIYCTRYSDPPCQLGVASVEPLNWQLFPVFGLADNHNVLQFQPECFLKTFSTANEKNRDVLFKRIHFCIKITFWLKSLSVSIFICVTVY